MSARRASRTTALVGACALGLLAAGCLPPRGQPPELSTSTTSSSTSTTEPGPLECDAEPNDTVGTATPISYGAPFRVCNNGDGDSGVDFFVLPAISGGTSLTIDCATTPSTAGQIIGLNTLVGETLTPVGTPVGCVEGALVVPSPSGTYVVGVVSTTAVADATITVTHED